MYYVYQHINKINGKRYIGITKQNPESRWGLNGANYKGSPYLYAAIQKYGWDNFEHEILFEKLTKEDACTKEIELITYFNTQNKLYGYNIMEGGSAPTIPEEIRKIISEKMRGNTNNLGHVCSEEKKRKISEAQKGRKLTEEHKAKLSMTKKGSHHASPSTETRKKISDSHVKKQVYCEENNIVYESIQSCAKELGLEPTAVCACCKGKHKSTHGYHLRYYNNTIKA
mgnify:CR=1 FL=1